MRQKMNSIKLKETWNMREIMNIMKLKRNVELIFSFWGKTNSACDL